MQIPSARNHKPVVVADHYDRVDGRYAGQSDASCVSLGLTAGTGGKAELSAKVWINTREMLSEPSDELPLHRVLDLSILICRALEHFNEAYMYEHLFNPEKPSIDRIGLQGSALNVSICTDNEEIREDIQVFNQLLSNDGELLGERLRALSRCLKELGF
ncbi:DUF6530 family protein [Paenibacillus chartarius]|uniref:DUF6530 family protein n=1 Tax=Paenibacillus chartarius TaxID=747481 RepID=A0ABV6DTJ7_9BACL